MTEEVTKDLIFEEPRVPNRYARADAEDKTSPRGYWTVSEVEEAMWRVRASGGTDSTPIVFARGERRGGMAIRAKHVEASPIYEVPRRKTVQCKACDDTGVLEGTGGKVCPVCRQRADEHEWWYRPAQIVGALIAIPCLLWVVLFVWSATLGSFFN
jgi:hypothetical protein